MNSKTNFCIVIPAYNEEEHIEQVITNCLAICKNVIVVDDGSTDATAARAEKAHAAGNRHACSVLLRHKVNQGKMAALSTGFRYALEKGFDYVVTIDADGQHDPADIKNLLEEAEKNAPDIIIGTRMAHTETMPPIRRWTNRTTSRILSRIMGQRITDSQSGFRMIKRRVLENITTEAKKFEGESEFLIKAARKGFIIKEVPITTIYGEQRSKIHPVKDTFRFIKLALKYMLTKNG